MTLGVGVDIAKEHLDLAVHMDKRVKRFTNTPSGIAGAVKWVQAREPSQVMVEATGGYELKLLEALVDAQLPAVRVNPRQARRFAQAIGELAKTDAIDARVLAHFASVVTFPRYVRPSAAQRELQECFLRREQIKQDKQRQTQRLQGYDDKQILAQIRRTIGMLDRQLATTDQRITNLMENRPEVPVLSLMKGVGPVLTAAILALLPELGRISNKAAAKLVGVAPLACDSGKHRGKRKIWGGRRRLRDVLYMASLSAARYEPSLVALKQRLLGKGKLAKVASVAVMNKMVVILNARMRDAIEQGIVPT